MEREFFTTCFICEDAAFVTPVCPRLVFGNAVPADLVKFCIQPGAIIGDGDRKGPGKREHIVADTLLPMMFFGLRKLGKLYIIKRANPDKISACLRGSVS